MATHDFSLFGWRWIAGVYVTQIILCGVVILAGCAGPQTGQSEAAGKVEFALIGDMPYDGKQEEEYANLMKAIDREDLAFVAHNGDMWGDGMTWKDTTKGLAPCGDAVFQDRLARAMKSEHPYIVAPGDNDWTDCWRAKPVPYDPIERLSKLRQMFFSGEKSLGQHTLPLTRQSSDPRYAKYRENVRWVYGDVMFVTLHMMGSNNNLGRTPDMDAEYKERNAANLAWMKQAFALAARNKNRAIMIIAQANPQFENGWPNKVQEKYMLRGVGLKAPEKKRTTGFDDFLAALEQETLAFGKPVVYVHGDTHLFRVDKPLYGSHSKRVIENFTRVETIGFPDTHWVRAIIDPNDPNVFTFKQEIVKENLVKH
ncbi:MAG: hypothetical protein OEY67_02915 [Gammaproteobacteria bacterium]|nr:hypothetical protein [Gammaproteobacteria bacterium]